MPKYVLLPLLILVSLASAYFLVFSSSSFPELAPGLYHGFIQNSDQSKSIILLNADDNDVKQVLIWKEGKLTSFSREGIARRSGIDSELLLKNKNNLNYELIGANNQLGLINGQVRDYNQDSKYRFELNRVELKTSQKSEKIEYIKFFQDRNLYQVLLDKNLDLQSKQEVLNQEILKLQKLVTEPDKLKNISDKKINELQQTIVQLTSDIEAEKMKLISTVKAVKRLRKVLPEQKLINLNRAIFQLENKLYQKSQKVPDFYEKAVNDFMLDYPVSEQDSKLAQLKAEVAKEKDLIYILQYKINKQKNE